MAAPWTVTANDSPGRWVALTSGRRRTWRTLTESGDELKWNDPRKKIPSTGPTRGRPSAVTVAKASRRMPSKRKQTSAAGSRRSGVMISSRWRPPVA